MSENDIQPDDVRSLREAALFFGVTAKTMSDWIRLQGCPVVKGGQPGVAYEVSLRQVAAWRDGLEAEAKAKEEAKAEADAQLKMELLGTGALIDGDASGRPVSARDKKAWVEAEIARARLAEMRRELVPVEEIRAALVEAMGQLRNGLLALPDRIGEKLGLEEADIALIAEEIRASLSDLADQVEAMEGDLSPAEVAHAAE
ncbi:DUF1441 family protein [Oceanibaculum indicum]|nr:DUF1441 family protein [Oceanibaculum indicum]